MFREAIKNRLQVIFCDIFSNFVYFKFFLKIYKETAVSDHKGKSHPLTVR
jgi:hypothetical protein